MGGALTIKNFCREYGIGSTLAYKLIGDGVLAARKCGRRTLISRESAEAWFNSLPAMTPGEMSYGRRYGKPTLSSRANVG